MRKFFDSRRELVSSGPGSGGGGGSSGSSHAGGNFIGRAFTIGRHQVTVEEIIAEGEKRRLHRPDDAICFCLFSSFILQCTLLIGDCDVRSSAWVTWLYRNVIIYLSHSNDGALHLCILETLMQKRGLLLSLLLTNTTVSWLLFDDSELWFKEIDTYLAPDSYLIPLKWMNEWLMCSRYCDFFIKKQW